MRRHGRNGLVYLSVRNGEDASLLAYLNSWSISWTHDLIETTAVRDTDKVYVAGLADVAGSFSGFLDDATSQTYIAVTDGLPRNMYLYPNSQNLGEFFSGSVLPDLAVTGGVTSPAAVTVNWVPSTEVTRTEDFGAYVDAYADPYT